MAKALFPQPGRARRRTQPSAELDITPMIDVTFLLLIFFMVSSTMRPTVQLDVPVAEHGVAVQSRLTTTITVRAGATEAASEIIWGDGGNDVVTLEELPERLSDAVLERREKIVVKAEGDVTFGLVQKVNRVIAETEGAELFVGVQDPKR